jgi:hypothetical protein
MAAESSPLPALGTRRAALWWFILPTLLYLFLSRNIVAALLLAAIAAGLRYAQSRTEVPAAIRPVLPLLMPVVTFIFLGGNLLVIAAVIAAIGAAVWQREQLLRRLAPWWQIQQRLSLRLRRVLAIVSALIIGYLFGVSASGNEWTYTFLSMALGTIAAFLLLFTPPEAL